MSSILLGLSKVAIPKTSYNEGTKLYETTSDAAALHIIKIRKAYQSTTEQMVGVCLNFDRSKNNPIAIVMAYAKGISIEHSLFCEPSLQTHIFTIPNLVNSGAFKLIFKALPETYEGLEIKHRFIEFLYQERAAVRFSLAKSL